MTGLLIVLTLWTVIWVALIYTRRRRLMREEADRMRDSGRVYLTVILATNLKDKGMALEIAERNAARRGNRLV